jgi:hypothetical protein
VAKHGFKAEENCRHTYDIKEVCLLNRENFGKCGKHAWGCAYTVKHKKPTEIAPTIDSYQLYRTYQWVVYVSHNAVYIQDSVLSAEYTPRNTLVMPHSNQPIHQRLGRLPKWKHDLLKNSKIYDEWLPLLTQGVMIVTDGGVSEGKGYFGITIAHQNTVIARGRGAARGDPHTMCSFRAEAYRLLAGLALLNSLLQQADKPPVTHSLHTDSASLLSRLEIATQRVPLRFWNKTDSDVVMQIVEEARHLTITRHYVKGHQDDVKKRSEMTLPEIYNIDSDPSATVMRYEMNQPARTVIPFPASRVNIYINE